MDENIVISIEEIKIKLENELLELKKEISNILIPESEKKNFKKENEEILLLLKKRERLIEKRLSNIQKEDYKKCEVCGEIINDKRFFIDPTTSKCLKHEEI